MFRCLSAAASSAPGASSTAKKWRKDSRTSLEDDPSRIRVVLRKDVKSLGRKGDIVYVKRGLMRHELYPSGDAAYATPENVALYALSESEKQAQPTDGTGTVVVTQLIKALNRKPVVVTRRPASADSETLPGRPVSLQDIREAVARQLGIRLHPSHLMLDVGIDTFGSFKVPLNLRLPDNQQAELTVHVDRRKKLGEAGTEAEAARGA